MAINYIHCTQVGHVEPALINMFTTDKVLTNATLKEVRHNLSALIVWSIYIFINKYIYIYTFTNKILHMYAYTL